MDNNIGTEISPGLESKRRSEIIDALYKLGRIQNINLDSKMLNKLLQLISHTDADIRQLAVKVAGMHHQLQKAYEIIIYRINNEEEKDQSVLITACASLGTLVTRGKGDKKETNQILARIVMNESLDPELRGTAYLSIQRINDKISVREYAASSRDIEQMKCDFQWVSSLVA
jgi:hypothetical protein